MEKPKELCSFHRCCESALKLPAAEEMVFCIEHDGRYQEVIARGTPQSLLSFWVIAQGGSRRAAVLAATGVSHRTLLAGEEVYWQP